MKKNFRYIFYLYLLLIPAFVIVFSILFYPLMVSLVLSFHKWTFSTYGQGNVPFIGFGNFAEMFADPYFWRSILNTLIFSGSSLAVEFFVSLGVALLLNRKLVGMRIIRTLVILPFVLSNAVIGLNWRLMYNYDYGIINYFLSFFNIKRVLWLSDPTKAMISVYNCGCLELYLFCGTSYFIRLTGYPSNSL